MQSLAEQQYQELRQAIRSGHVAFADVLVLGRFVCEKRGDTLVRHIQCEREHTATILHTILARDVEGQLC